MGIDRELCRKGGLSRSRAKKRAARINGRKGGREQSRTLAERLLRRRIAEDQQKAVTAAFKDFHITYRERDALIDFFDVLPWDKHSDHDALHSKSYKWPRARIRKDILQTIRIFRILAVEGLRKIGKPKPPKDYVVQWIAEERSDAEQERWYHENSTHPLPRRRTNHIYFRDTAAYKHFDNLLSLDAKRAVPTAEEIKDAFGAQVGFTKLCEAIADDLKAKYPRHEPS